MSRGKEEANIKNGRGAELTAPRPRETIRAGPQIAFSGR